MNTCRNKREKDDCLAIEDSRRTMHGRDVRWERKQFDGARNSHAWYHSSRQCHFWIKMNESQMKLWCNYKLDATNLRDRVTRGDKSSILIRVRSEILTSQVELGQVWKYCEQTRLLLFIKKLRFFTIYLWQIFLHI